VLRIARKFNLRIFHNKLHVYHAARSSMVNLVHFCDVHFVASLPILLKCVLLFQRFRGHGQGWHPSCPSRPPHGLERTTGGRTARHSAGSTTPASDGRPRPRLSKYPARQGCSQRIGKVSLPSLSIHGCKPRGRGPDGSTSQQPTKEAPLMIISIVKHSNGQVTDEELH
jgi:hypothetical protein